MGSLNLKWMYRQPRTLRALLGVALALSCAGCQLMDVSRGDLWADAAASQDGPCAEKECPAGTRCELVEVECVRAPCDPVAECVKSSGRDGATENGGKPARDGGLEPDDASAPSGGDDDEGSPDGGSEGSVSDPVDAGVPERDAGDDDPQGEPDAGSSDPSCGGRECPHGWTCERTAQGPRCKPLQGDPCDEHDCADGTECVVWQGTAWCVPARSPGCAVVLCPEGTYCDDLLGCVPLSSCGTKACDPGTHCELQQVQCIRAPCPPVPTCVPNRKQTRCGTTTCSEGEVCCNPTCGICTAPDELCIQQACDWTQ